MFFLEIVLVLYFGYTSIYSSILLLAGFFYKDVAFKHLNHQVKLSKFCILIPAYKEDSVILKTVQENLKITYPKDKFDIFVIADSLSDKTITLLKELPINVIVVSFEISTKVKALNEALLKLPNNYDYTLILDADNVMEEELLNKINQLHGLGFEAIQVQRVPKNNETNLALLDGLSEAVNYSIISKGGTVLQQSPGIKGSGMSFNFEILKKLLAEMNSVGGFDRELELKLIEDNITIYYSHNSKIFDEKVSSMEVFKNQRRRWISSQFFYLRKYFLRGVKLLWKGNFNFFNTAILRNIQLPRILNMGLLGIVTLLFLSLRTKLFFDFKLWIILFVLNILIIILAIPKEFYTRRHLRAFLELPKVLLNMGLLLFKLKGANKKFIHTPKSSGS